MIYRNYKVCNIYTLLYRREAGRHSERAGKEKNRKTGWQANNMNTHEDILTYKRHKDELTNIHTTRLTCRLGQLGGKK